MVIFPGNLVCNTSFWHQRLVLLVPWVKLSQFPGNTCSRCRVYCSSSLFPVRYIPNQSSKAKETKTSPLPITGSEDEEMRSDSDPNVSRVEVSNGSHRSFVLDEKSQSRQNQNQTLINKFTFGTKPGVEEEEVRCDLGIADHKLLEDLEELKIHQGKDPRNQDALLEGKTKQDAENLAIEFLATRAFTAVELRKKLHGKRFHLDTVDAVIKDFQGRGFINDCLYAETFSRSRWSSLKWGPMRIKKALLKKGVSEVEAKKAIKLVFEDGDSGGDQESRLGLSKLSMDQLFVQATKQWLRGRNVPCETRKSRIIRWLQYRGFNWDVIIVILKKLQSEYPP